MSPVKDYIPAPDSEAAVWMRNYAAFTISNGASNGLTGPYNTLPTQMNSAYTAFDASLRALAAAEAALRAAAGKQAHYLIRWTTTKNQPGPWSELHSATIAAV